MTPLTPATPLHSNMSEHSGSSFGNSGSPTFPGDCTNNNSSGKSSMHNAPSLAALLQETDPLLPVPVMNHSVQQTPAAQQPASASQPQQPHHHQQQLHPPGQNGGPPNPNPSNLQNISELDINESVNNNPNL